MLTGAASEPNGGASSNSPPRAPRTTPRRDAAKTRKPNASFLRPTPRRPHRRNGDLAPGQRRPPAPTAARDEHTTPLRDRHRRDALPPDVRHDQNLATQHRQHRPHLVPTDFTAWRPIRDLRQVITKP